MTHVGGAYTCKRCGKYHRTTVVCNCEQQKTNNMKKPIHKFNGGLGATLCHHCKVIITTGLTKDIYCKNCADNKVTYLNRYRDEIIFEHIGDTVTMTGGNWFRYGWANVYTDAYQVFLEDTSIHGISVSGIEEFEKLVHDYNNEVMKQYAPLVYSDKDKICFVDPSGGPFIGLGDNLNEFWPYDEKYQNLIVESISLSDTKDENTVVTFKIKQ